MSYQEALNLKSQYGNSMIENNREFLILIAPKNIDDLLKFLANYKEDSYNAKTCKTYSTNNEFQIYVYMSEVSRELLS